VGRGGAGLRGPDRNREQLEAVFGSGRADSIRTPSLEDAIFHHGDVQKMEMSVK
jgi:hypothetical protein